MIDDAAPAGPVYDEIGTDYATGRQPDPRWAGRILAALGRARTVVNVGAGSGSYEPADRYVLAVEPSRTMIAQRPPGSAPVLRAGAERLPLADRSFDAALAILTVHHWTDLAAGIGELRRVAARQVVLTYDWAGHAEFWLTDYIPEIAVFEQGRAPAVDRLAALLDADDIVALPVPADMRDGVLAAHWQRPAAYLDPRVRARCSGLAQLDPSAVERGIDHLRRDLGDGTWERRYGRLRAQDEYDAGFRLVTAGL